MQLRLVSESIYPHQLAHKLAKTHPWHNDEAARHTWQHISQWVTHLDMTYHSGELYLKTFSFCSLIITKVMGRWRASVNTYHFVDIWRERGPNYNQIQINRLQKNSHRINYACPLFFFFFDLELLIDCIFFLLLWRSTNCIGIIWNKIITVDG